MANAFYRKGAEKTLSAQINFSTDSLKVALVKSAYAPNLATDEFYSAISANVLNTPQAAVTPVVTNGVFDAADVTFSAVTSGDTSNAVVVYKDTGNPATSPLLLYIDTITGFPLTTNGGDIIVQWDNGAYKIFSL